MIRTAAEVADGLVGHPLYTRRYLREVVHPTVAEGLRRGERERSEFELAGYVITAISHDAAEAREEARRQIAFYATTLTYAPILDLHGWQPQREAIRQAFLRFDVAAMAAAVTDEMVDQMAIAGTPDDCQRRLEEYAELLDHVLFYPPSFAVSPGRLRENYALIAEVFGEWRRDPGRR